MSRPHVAVASAVAVFVVLPFVARGSQSVRAAGLILTGEVTMASSADGRLALVTVDLDTAASPADAVIDHAFRIQHLRPASLEAVGRGRVVFKDGQLMVSTGLRTLVFVPLGRLAPEVPFRETREINTVAGITRFWGPALRMSERDIAARLLRPDCWASLTTVEGSGSCGSCQVGGPGVPGCLIDCGDELCEPTCGDGHFACCNCSGFCGCCSNQIQ